MLASKIYKAYKTNTEAFPKNDIPTLQEIAIQVVANNFTLYPDLPGVREDIKNKVRKWNWIDHFQDIHKSTSLNIISPYW